MAREPFEPDVDPRTANQLEVVAQQIMTARIVMAEAISVANDWDGNANPEIAEYVQEVVMDALSKLLEVIAVQSGQESEYLTNAPFLVLLTLSISKQQEA